MKKKIKFDKANPNQSLDLKKNYGHAFVGRRWKRTFWRHFIALFFNFETIKLLNVLLKVIQRLNDPNSTVFFFQFKDIGYV